LKQSGIIGRILLCEELADNHESSLVVVVIVPGISWTGGESFKVSHPSEAIVAAMQEHGNDAIRRGYKKFLVLCFSSYWLLQLAPVSFWALDDYCFSLGRASLSSKGMYSWG
jgi:hypothetical protein